MSQSKTLTIDQRIRLMELAVSRGSKGAVEMPGNDFENRYKKMLDILFVEPNTENNADDILKQFMQENNWPPELLILKAKNLLMENECDKLNQGQEGNSSQKPLKVTIHVKPSRLDCSFRKAISRMFQNR